MVSSLAGRADQGETLWTTRSVCATRSGPAEKSRDRDESFKIVLVVGPWCPFARTSPWPGPGDPGKSMLAQRSMPCWPGCTDAPNPVGESGRAWCYVEAQLRNDEQAWNFCAPVIDYNAVRASMAPKFEEQANKARAWVRKLQKAQKAAEQTLDEFAPACA
jgi:hypothetical protein